MTDDAKAHVDCIIINAIVYCTTIGIFILCCRCGHISAKRINHKTLFQMLWQGIRSPTCTCIAPVQVASAVTYSLGPKTFVVFSHTGQPNGGKRSIRVCRMSDNSFELNDRRTGKNRSRKGSANNCFGAVYRAIMDMFATVVCCSPRTLRSQ